MKLHTFISLSLAGMLAFGCSTDDVVEDPLNSGITISLSSDASGMVEDGGSVTVTATLSEAASIDVTAELSFSGTAEGNGVDYTVDSEAIIIASGSLSSAITITAVQDTLEEGSESIVVEIANVVGAEAEESSLNLFIEDDDVPFQAQIILNEICYDPSNNGLEGDTNGDGTYAQSEDEFLEFVNLSSQEVDMSGYMVFDTEALNSGEPRHTFPAGSLVPAGGAIVVFGGGSPSGSFGGAVIQTSTTGNMNLNNAGDIMTLTDPNGEAVISFDIEPLSNNPNESYTRNPDITGDFVQHGDVTDVLFSPGTRLDGTPF